MEKWIKLLIAFCLILTIGGCKQEETITYPPIDITLFFVDSCQHCQAFKEEAVPALEEEFGDALTMHYVNMDFEGNKVYYEEFTNQLEGYKEELYLVPFIVVDGYFAILMYNNGEYKELISDIHLALEGKELGKHFKNERWIFKEEFHA